MYPVMVVLDISLSFKTLLIVQGCKRQIMEA